MTETEFMLTSLLGCRRVDLFSRQISLTANQQIIFDQMKNRRSTGEPLQYILGSCEFMGLDLAIDKRALVPRPETELLVEIAIDQLKERMGHRPVKVLELGTGSGNIAIALASNIKHIKITSVDISREAQMLASLNISLHGFKDRIDLVCEDMRTYLKKQMPNLNEWDMIISNPPYIKANDINNLPQDVRFEPCLALDGGPDGLKYYREIFKYGHGLLTEKGFILVEMGDDQFPELARMLEKNYQDVKIFKDYVQTPRILMASK